MEGQVFERRIMLIMRWFARLVSIVLLILLVLPYLSAELHNPVDLNSVSRAAYFALGLMLVGLIAAWFHGGLGGGLILVGYLIFGMVQKDFWIGPVFPLFLVPGVLFLLCWCKSRGIIKSSC